MRAIVILFTILLWNQGIVNSIRIVELRVPGHAAAGSEALLGCQFDLEDDLLYAVNWYKDDRMFYKYMPRKSIAFNNNGVTVDIARSSSDVVTLVNLTTDSAGVYRCEVTGEAPNFANAAREKYITIYILPGASPQISGARYHYGFEDTAIVNCTAPASRPEAQLKWLINNRPVSSKHLLGPWRRVVENPFDAVETTLGLRFKVGPKNFVNDVMELKCQATIAPLYQKEKIHTALIRPGSRRTTAKPTFHEPVDKFNEPTIENGDIQSEAVDKPKPDESRLNEQNFVVEPTPETTTTSTSSSISFWTSYCRSFPLRLFILLRALLLFAFQIIEDL